MSDEYNRPLEILKDKIRLTLKDNSLDCLAKINKIYELIK